MSDIVTKSVASTKDTYKVSCICNSISSLTFALLTAANIIEKGFTSFTNIPLGFFALLFGGVAVFSIVKYRTSKS